MRKQIKKFFNWKEIDALKLKTKKNYYVCEGVRLLLNTSLFMLSIASNFNDLFYYTSLTLSRNSKF